MASFLNLRPHRPSDPSEGSRMSRRRLVTAALVLAASVIAFALAELATQGNHAVRSTPEFLTRALGAPAPSTSLVRSPAPKLKVAIGNHGFTYTNAGSAPLGLPALRP